ncbi:hypothetical protein Z955_02350, partial [Clostridium botulinum C/D str. DC5]
MFLLLNKIRIKDNNGKDLNFDKIVKGKNNIHCYIKDNIYMQFEGILDISTFEVEDGEFIDNPKTTEELQAEINAQLLKDSANLQIQLNKQTELNADLLIKIAQLGG